MSSNETRRAFSSSPVAFSKSSVGAPAGGCPPAALASRRAEACSALAACGGAHQATLSPAARQPQVGDGASASSAPAPRAAQAQAGYSDVGVLPNPTPPAGRRCAARPRAVTSRAGVQQPRATGGVGREAAAAKKRANKVFCAPARLHSAAAKQDPVGSALTSAWPSSKKKLRKQAPPSNDLPPKPCKKGRPNDALQTNATSNEIFGNVAPPPCAAVFNQST